MIGSKKLTIGAMYRKDVKVRLDELGLPYTEHRSLVESIIIVKVHTEQQKAAYDVFMGEFTAFLRRLAALDRQEELEELARKNRFRRLTFRKPLTSLPR
jgi:hypothetical protein